jgi:hypothetical protein
MLIAASLRKWQGAALGYAGDAFEALYNRFVHFLMMFMIHEQLGWDQNLHQPQKERSNPR